MLHGLWMGSIATWYFTSAPELAMHHQVIMYDLRGHGKSEKAPSGYDIDTLTSDLESLIESLELETVSFVGYSFGAMVALNYSLRHKKSVHKLALIEATLPPIQTGQVEDYMNKSPEEMVKLLPEWQQQILFKGGRRAKNLLQNIDFLANESTLIQDLKDLENIDTFDKSLLNQIDIPTILIYGNDSEFKSSGDKLYRAINDATFIVLPGGHNLPLESSKEVTRHLKNFFRNNFV